MPAWQIVIDPRAEDEARAAFLWYLDRSPSAAEDFQVALEAALASIAEAPRRWPEVEPRIRKRVLGHYPYSVLYTIDGSVVTILVLMHHRRRPGYWKSP